MEFSHPCFQRDNPYLLEHIKRKISTAKTSPNDDKSLLKTEIVTKVLSEVKQVKGRQDSLDSRFVSMKQENEALWREMAIFRQKHMKQQQIVNKLIQFLVTIVQPQRGSGISSMGGMGGVKRRFQLMINDVPEAKLRKTSRRSSASSSGGGGPIIRELTEELFDYEDPDDETTSPTSPYIVSPGCQKHDINELDNIEDLDESNMEYSDGSNLLDDNGEVIYDENSEVATTATNSDAGPSTSNKSSNRYAATNTMDPSTINYVIESVDNITPQEKNVKLPTRPQYQLRQQPSNSSVATKIKTLPVRDAKTVSTTGIRKQPLVGTVTSKQIPLATVTSGGKSLLNAQNRAAGGGGMINAERKQLANTMPQIAKPNLQANLAGKRIVSNASNAVPCTPSVTTATITSVSPTASNVTSTQKKAYTNKDDFISTEIPTDLFGDTEQVYIKYNLINNAFSDFINIYHLMLPFI